MRLMDGGSGGGVTAYDKKYSTPKPYQATTDNGRSAYLRKLAATTKPKTTKKKTTTNSIVKPSSRVVSSRYVTPTPTTPAAQVTPFTPTTTTPAASPGYAGLTTNYLNQLTGSVNKIYDQQKAAQLAQIKADQTASSCKVKPTKDRYSGFLPRPAESSGCGFGSKCPEITRVDGGQWVECFRGKRHSSSISQFRPTKLYQFVEFTTAISRQGY
jgi:hypothetical protein